MPSLIHARLAYNNVYLVEDDGARILIDTGPDYRGAFEALLESIDGTLPDMVVATHAHIDHAGMGAAWVERGVPVYLAREDADSIGRVPLGDRDMAAMCAYVRSVGAPAEVENEIVATLARRREAVRNIYAPEAEHPEPTSHGHWPTPLLFRPYPARTLTAETRLPGGLRWLPCPGHTPGNLVLYHPAEGWLFSGDQLLPEITPTPGIQPAPPGSTEWRFRSLPAFAASLRQVALLDASHCYPGHGEPFSSAGAAIAENLARIEERAERVWRSLREEGPATVYTLAERMYPRALKRRFWEIVATIQGTIDCLEDAGRVEGGRNGLWDVRV